VELSILADPEAVAQAAAKAVARDLAGGGSLVLAGGSTPKRSYEILAGLEVPWGRVTVLFGDERCVPPDDRESNYRMACETLLDRVRPLSVHRMPGELGAEAAAVIYGALVARLRPLDVVTLGVGEDGHTASLFPGHPESAAGGDAVAVHDSPKPPPDRVSLTLEVLREARRVYVLATGAAKREAIAAAMRGEVPAGMIPGARWLVDQEAAG
jgi:6-phosphogluconolactonase